MPESLGGPRDFRLLTGTVCDSCNRGVLKEIDEQLNLHPLFRLLRFQFGLGPRFSELQRGVRRQDNEIQVDATKLGANATVKANLVLGGGGTITLTTSGPTEARNEWLPRGLHRMAFNAIAHACGPEVARRDYQHLRSYALTGYETEARTYLIDEKTFGESLQHPGPWTAGYSLINDGNKPSVAWLRFGRLFFFVSVEPTTNALTSVTTRFPWVRVVGHLGPTTP